MAIGIELHHARARAATLRLCRLLEARASQPWCCVHGAGTMALSKSGAQANGGCGHPRRATALRTLPASLEKWGLSPAKVAAEPARLPDRWGGF